jgi:uncharacterized protein
LELPTLSYRLIPQLAELGATASLTGVLPLTVLEKGALHLTLVDGIAYDLQLTNTGNGVLLVGVAHARATTECARCLEEALVEVQGDVECYFMLNPRDEELELIDEDMVMVGADGMVDLAPPILATIVFELPQVVLCREDCAGLCPVCGANRTTTECACADAPSTSGPFAALRDLL